MVPFPRSTKLASRKGFSRLATQFKLLFTERRQCLAVLVVALLLLGTWGLVREMRRPLDELLVADGDAAGVLSAAALNGGAAAVLDKEELRAGYAVNFGGPAFTVPSTGRVFEDGRVPSLGKITVDDADIEDAQPSLDHAPLYATATHSGPALHWLLPAMLPGVYVLTLYFAELTYAAAGMRSYDIYLQGDNRGLEQVAGGFDPLAAAGGGLRRGVALSFANIHLRQGRLVVTVSHAGRLDPNVCLNALSLTQDNSAPRHSRGLPLGNPLLRWRRGAAVSGAFLQPTEGHNRLLKHKNYSCELRDANPGPVSGPSQFSIKGDPNEQTGLQGPGAAAVPLPYVWVSHPSATGLRVVGPSGAPLELQELGRFLGYGDHVYAYSVDTAGDHSVMYHDAVIATFATHPEESDCPEAFEEFEARYQCSVDDATKAEDIFRRWEGEKVLTEEFFEGVWNDFNDGTREDMRFILHFTILDNKLFWRYPKDVAAHAVFIDLVLSLLRKARVPDVEFFYNSADFARVTIFDLLPPIFSFSALPHQGDVLVPHPIAVSEMYFSSSYLQAATGGLRWGQREEKAFFWGSNSGYRSTGSMAALRHDRRWRTYFHSKRRPDLLEVFVVPEHSGQFSNETLEYLRRGGDLVKAGSGSEARGRARQHRYSLVLDGNSAPGDSAQKLASGALVLKQESPFAEHFFDLLRPCRHYLPVDHYLGDLGDAVEWARKYDSVARQIQMNGFHLVMNRVRPQDTACYMAYLLRALAAVQHFQPKVREGMTPIPQPAQDLRHKCQYGGPTENRRR